MIKGKRAFLANLLYQTGAYRGFRHLDAKRLVIFNFHRIRSSSPAPHAFDEGVYGPNQEELRQHMQWIKRNADLISEQELIDHVKGKMKLPKTSVMVTFDDGYRDNADLALPIMKELSIPAIFFISTRAIIKRELGWWDTIAYLIKKTTHNEIILRGRRFDLRPPRDAVILELQEWMRTQPSNHTRYLLNEISTTCKVPLPDVETCSNELMSWEQIKEIAACGLTIGSHTHSHRVLSTLNLSDQLKEFRVSKKILEKKLNQPIRSIAYPVGGHEDCDLETGELAEQSGYDLGFSFQTGTNKLDHFDPFSIGRISAEDTLPLTCAAVTLPSLFARSRSSVKGKRPPLASFQKQQQLSTIGISR